jgi:hypothetical protein
MKVKKMKDKRKRRNAHTKIYMKTLLVPYTLGSTVAFIIFKEAIGKLLYMTFCRFFCFLFLIFSQYMRNRMGYRVSVTSALIISLTPISFLVLSIATSQLILYTPSEGVSTMGEQLVVFLRRTMP